MFLLRRFGLLALIVQIRGGSDPACRGSARESDKLGSPASESVGQTDRLLAVTGDRFQGVRVLGPAVTMKSRATHPGWSEPHRLVCDWG